MEKELLLLRKLHTNPGITQRDMAKATGISVGSVNALIKELVNRGILNVDKVTKRTASYKLTAEGLKQRAESMYRYIMETYAFIKEFSQRIDDLLKTGSKQGYTLILYGDKDDIYDLIVMKLVENKIGFNYTNEFDKLVELSKHDNLLVIIWQPECINTIKEINCSYVDILNNI